MRENAKTVATFSIVAFDPETGSLGVAVHSKFLAAGALVPHARAGVGAVATQALANVAHGPRGLGLMAQGKTASETVGLLAEEDEQKAQRQVGIVDAGGRAAAFTGEDCHDWAGSLTGEHYAIQGNILAGREVVEAMAGAYEEAGGEDLAGRLLAALEAGQEAGGDPRGKQSAALLVVREGGGYGGNNDRLVDLRVDDHPEPIKELARIRGLHALYFGETKPEDVVAVEGEVGQEVVAHLQRFGYLEGRDPGDDGAVLDALRDFLHIENFEEREQERGYLDLEVLRFMRSKR
ncbi:MAG: DUF1028 domain-containing protein [Rubrobacter sp.]|nr:DUF1028 domain-containing protein [Rubrobacter sp.]